MVSVTPVNCVGVDGAGAGWVAARRVGTRLDLQWYASVAALMQAHTDAAVVAVDMVIGLPDAGPRRADTLARRWIGAPRSASVYPAPVRGVLEAQSQRAASAQQRAIDGRGVSVQTFALLPKIRAWDDWLGTHPQSAARVFEVHPEVSFRALASAGKVLASKHHPQGLLRRRQLLAQAFGRTRVWAALARVHRAAPAVGEVDALDALAALWSAERIARGTAQGLPDPPEHDARGRRMAIYV